MCIFFYLTPPPTVTNPLRKKITKFIYPGAWNFCAYFSSSSCDDGVRARQTLTVSLVCLILTVTTWTYVWGTVRRRRRGMGTEGGGVLWKRRWRLRLLRTSRVHSGDSSGRERARMCPSHSRDSSSCVCVCRGTDAADDARA